MRFASEQPRSARKSFLSRHRGTIVAILIVAALLALQWPVVKGIFYRVSGAVEPTGDIRWKTDFMAAQAESKTTGKPVLVDFSANWCPPCQTMKHEVWPDREVGELVNRSFIPVLVDLSSGGSEVASRYGVTSIPTILVVDGEGKVLHRASFMSRSATVEFLKRAS